MFGRLPDELINKILSYNYVKPKYLMEMKLAGKLLNRCEQLKGLTPETDEFEDQVDDFEDFLDYFPTYTQFFFGHKLDKIVGLEHDDDAYDPIYNKERRALTIDRYNYVWSLPDPIAKLIEVFEIRFTT